VSPPFIHAQVRCGFVIAWNHLHAKNVRGKIVAALNVAGANADVT
jgi:hypothetical protein